MRAFEAVARNASVAKAGEELGVTATAVSHQLRSLEEYLQVRLFERRGNKLTVTQDAAAQIQPLGEALDMIDAAISALQTSAAPHVTRIVIGASPSFTTFWLMPRLRAFMEAVPNVDLAFNTFLSPQEAEAQKSDVRICNWHSETGASGEPLLEEASVPVCAPALAAQYQNDTEKLLRDAPLIHVDRSKLGLTGDYPDWPRYFSEFGIERPNALQGSSFNQAAIAIDAAKDGVGILLGRTLLTETYLKTGDLVAVAPHFPTQITYFMRRDPSSKHQEDIDRVCDWLRSAAASPDDCTSAT